MVFTKPVKSTLGYVADHCPICRGMRAFELSHSESYRITCETCGTETRAVLNTYASVARERGGDLTELMRETFPNFHEFYRDRLTADELPVRDYHVRQRLMTETVQLMAPEASAWRFANRALVDKLGRSLAPFRPTELELAGILQDFKKAGFKIGRGVKAADLMRAMRN